MPGTGWPLKSYGFMMMLGFLSGVYLAMRRAMRVKSDPDTVLNCAIIALFAGVAGARIFYVIHYWNDYFAFRRDWLTAVFNITQGGLEFLGGLIGATTCIVFYLWRAKKSIRLYTDILVVSTMWSLGIARIGCFLNGCCFGGVCLSDNNGPGSPLAVQFPFASPTFVHQWEDRKITLPAELISDSLTASTSLPIWAASPIGRDDLSTPVELLNRPQREYEKAVRDYNEAKAENPDSEKTKALKQLRDMKKQLYDEHRLKFHALLRAERFPSRNDPGRPNTTLGELQTLAAKHPALWSHPTQLYSSTSAILLSFLLGRVFFRRKRHGMVFGLMLLTYPISRILLESIRTDNPLDVGGLTVSQAISVGMIVTGIVYLFILYRFFPERSPLAVPFVPEPQADDKG